MDKKTFSPLFFMVLTTEADLSLARALATALLERNLVACVSLREVESQYWWKGQLEDSKEIQLIIKTKEEKLRELLKKVEELHSYETPELIYWPVSLGESYKNWFNSSVTPDKKNF